MNNNLIRRIIKKIINEDAVDYGDYEERMDPIVQKKIEDPEGIYAKNRAFRGGSRDVERLAGSRFKEIVDYVKDYFGERRNLTNPTVKREIQMQQMMAVQEAMSIEPLHREKLRDLALEIAAKEEGWMNPNISLQDLIDNGVLRKRKKTDGGVVYEMKFINLITYLGEKKINPKIFQMEPPKLDKLPIPPNFSFDVDELTPEEEFQLEVEKRNVINALIQGTGKKMQYAFQLYKNRLDQIDPRLYPLYNKIMGANDLMYFTDQQLIEMLGGNAAGSMGKDEDQEQTCNSCGGEGADEDGDDCQMCDGEGEVKRPTWFANGLIFPILLHELGKVFDAIPARGQWTGMDPELANRVISQTDTMANEPMNFRVGTELLKRLRFLLPDELLLDPESRIYLPYFKRILYRIPSQEFLREIISNVISEDPKDQKKVRKRFEEILSQAKKDYDRYESNKRDNEDDYDEDYDDDYSNI